MTITVKMSPDDPRHGTANGYHNLKCRCQPCKTAHAASVREKREARRLRGLPPGDPRHGKESTYTNWRCPCDLCRIAHTDYNRTKGYNQAK